MLDCVDETHIYAFDIDATSQAPGLEFRDSSDDESITYSSTDIEEYDSDGFSNDPLSSIVLEPLRLVKKLHKLANSFPTHFYLIGGFQILGYFGGTESIILSLLIDLLGTILQYH